MAVGGDPSREGDDYAGAPCAGYSKFGADFMTNLDISTVRQLEVLDSLQDFVGENLGMLVSIDKAWQPSDYLPDLQGEDWREQLEQFRRNAAGLSDETLVVLVGDMVTEEALPSYSVALNLLASDYTGCSDQPWAKWSRGWTAEENRHGDLLNAYLRLTGRVDMRAVEVTVNYLLNRGFNPRAYPDVYGGLVYTSFQERATKISHANVGRLAAAGGDEALGKICQKIAGDESRHEAFYTTVMDKIMDLDPNAAMISFYTMMRQIIPMPGKLMFDGKDADLFDHFAAVAQRLKVYTVHDYVQIVSHLCKAWNIAGRSVNGRAAHAQEYLCNHSMLLTNIADQATDAWSLIGASPVSFSWIHGRKV